MTHYFLILKISHFVKRKNAVGGQYNDYNTLTLFENVLSIFKTMTNNGLEWLNECTGSYTFENLVLQINFERQQWKNKKQKNKTFTYA